MPNSQDQLASLLTQHALSSAGYKPLILQPRPDMDITLLSALLQDSHVMVFDTLVTQLGELLKSRHPQERWSRLALDAAIQAHIGSNEQIGYGVWVYYSWSRRLVAGMVLADNEEVHALQQNFAHYWRPQAPLDQQAALYRVLLPLEA